MESLGLSYGFLPQLGFAALAKSKPSASERAKYKIARALEELMLVRPYSGISVLSLAEKANVSRQTFYNHFVDKDDLVTWIDQQLNQASYARVGIDLTWDEAVRLRFLFMKSKEPFYSELYRGDVSATPFEHEVDSTYKSYEHLLGRISGMVLDEETSSSLRFFCYGERGLVYEWVRSGMPEPIEALIRVEQSSLPGFANRVLLA